MAQPEQRACSRRGVRDRVLGSAVVRRIWMQPCSLRVSLGVVVRGVFRAPFARALGRSRASSRPATGSPSKHCPPPGCAPVDARRRTRRSRRDELRSRPTGGFHGPWSATTRANQRRDRVPDSPIRTKGRWPLPDGSSRTHSAARPRPTHPGAGEPGARFFSRTGGTSPWRPAVRLSSPNALHLAAYRRYAGRRCNGSSGARLGCCRGRSRALRSGGIPPRPARRTARSFRRCRGIGSSLRRP